MASPAPSTLTTFSEMPDLPMAPDNSRSNSERVPQGLVSTEQTPTSLVVKLRLPMHRLHDLTNSNASISASIHSSPPPSSPLMGPIADPAKPAKKKSKSKKPKLANGADSKAPEATGPQPPGPRLGPKSSAGAINDNLRALDRSGKPCRRWSRRPIVIQSLYGAAWKAPSWIGQGTKTAS